ncbi:MAG: hypothetical protein HRU17_22810 [Polyangiaceae bacterium]|nr:hypothetical protein [Polyangiaceae bacterium]
MGASISSATDMGTSRVPALGVDDSRLVITGADSVTGPGFDGGLDESEGHTGQG